MLKIVEKLHNIAIDLEKEGLRSEETAELLKEQGDTFIELGKEAFRYLQPFIIHQKGD